MDRRKFLKAGTMVTVGLGAGTMLPFRNAWAYVQSNPVPKFVTPLRRVGTDIPVMQSDGIGFNNAIHYTIDARQFSDTLTPGGSTRLWGFGQGGVDSFRHLGGVIVAERGKPVQVTFRNFLPNQHILPVDASLPGAEGAHNRISVHLHGGFTPWVSDGVPHSWWAPDGQRGHSFVDMGPTLSNTASAPNAAEFYFPNNQSARVMWYHDHAMGNTRLNAYAGLASAYVLTDSYEAQLVAQNGLPGPLDARTHYLIFQDKIFVPPNIDAVDPSWATDVPGSKPGDLWYPHVYEPARWALGPPTPTQPLPPTPSVVPEMFGDTILVNGTSYPTLTLEARVHRLRLLNACNARFLNPRLVYAQAAALTEPDITAPGPAFTQIGTEGGFLPAPVAIKGNQQLLLAPAERADLIVDLRTVAPGSTLILYNDAPGPLPMGDPRYDYYPGNPNTPASSPGFGHNTRTLLQIKVVAATSIDPLLSLPNAFTLADPFLVNQVPKVATAVPPGTTVRRLTLNEGFDDYGRLIQFLGTDQPVNVPPAPTTMARTYEAPPTEVITKGSTEVWEIINLTADTHPIHFHLVNVQILNRQRFSSKVLGRGKVLPYSGGPIKFSGQPVAPDANELGWKETVRVNPGEVTRVMIRFDLPAVPFAVPPSPRLKDGPYGSYHEYVWHCHILEHEEHDMMRPLLVSP
jgi:spore coat protein A, manganese oxidase